MTSALLPSYDELWVISDIHMGGEKSAARNFQIFNRGERLAAFIEHLRKQPAKSLALVLNGDVIDSLAEDVVPGYIALDVDTAESLMRRIYEDPSFKPVWSALEAFVKTEGRHLVFVLGNHDVEMALTCVQRSIRRRLANGKPAVDARVVFAANGGGFSCTVGASRVFCTHGNEVDLWNDVNYSRVAQLDNAMNAGRRIEATRWEPNAGTRLVVDVMNNAKARHPFVDLLKPETKPVLGVLLALDPGLMKEIDFGAGFEVVRELLRGDRRVSDLLSASSGDLSAVPPMLAAQVFANEVLGSALRAAVRSERRGDEDALLIAAELAMGQGDRAIVASTGDPATLGFIDIVKGWFGLVDKSEGLRCALLDWIGKDTETWSFAAKDQTFADITARVGPEVDYVVTGHTHLARSVEFGSGHYFNCGTWIRLLRLTPEALADKRVFEEHVYEPLRAGRMDALDEAMIPSADGPVPLVIDRTHAVKISAGPKAMEAALMRVTDSDGRGSDLKVEAEKVAGR